MKIITIAIQILNSFVIHLCWLDLVLALERLWDNATINKVFELHIDDTPATTHNFLVIVCNAVWLAINLDHSAFFEICRLVHKETPVGLEMPSSAQGYYALLSSLKIIS